MYPAVKPPKGLIARPVDFKLKPGWRYDEAERVFVSGRGARFAPPPLPKKSRIVYKVPTLAKAAKEGLSKAERDLQRYMQVILPVSQAPEDLAPAVQSWPCVEEARAAPEVSLPAVAMNRKPGRSL